MCFLFIFVFYNIIIFYTIIFLEFKADTVHLLQKTGHFEMLLQKVCPFTPIRNKKVLQFAYCKRSQVLQMCVIRAISYIVCYAGCSDHAQIRCL